IVLDASASTGNPVLSFIWDNGLGAGISHIVYPAVTTFYSVTVTDGNGCCNTTGVNISVNSLPIAITSNDTIICFGNNVTLNAASSSGNPMLSYYWDNGLGAGISHFVTPLTTTDYSVTVTDGNGCSAANSVLVTVAPLPVIDSMIVDNVQCYGESSGSVTVNVSAGSPSFSYNWGGTVSPGGQTCDSLPSGTYYVTVSDIYGCTASGLVQISQPDLLTISGDSYPASCSGNDGWAYVMVTGGTFPYSYVWSHDSFLDNDTASGLPGDTYIITVTDGNLCQDTCSVFVDSHQAGNMNAIVISNVQCFGYANGSVSITLTGSTAPYTVIIEGDTLIYADSVIVIDNLPAGSFNFTIIDGNECSFNTTQIITSPPQMTASVQINNIQCYNFDNGSITLNVTGGTPDYSYVWTPGYFSSNPVTSLAPGLYDVSVTDNAGCSFFLQDIAVSQPSPISVSLTVQDIACYGDNNGSITAFVTGGNEPYGYLWSVGSEENTATGLTAGEYMLTVTDANFCISENSATVIFLSDSIKITGTSGISPETRKGYILIDISGGTLPYSFIWSNGQTTKDIYGLSAGEYSVTLTDADNCIATGSYYIETPLIIPNLITPNGDGYNDDFFIQGIDSFDHISIEIFNRWGNKIYTYDGTGIDYLNGNERFNGTWNGEQLPFGGYIYILNTGEGDHSFTGVLSIKY
ncbi:MAG: gliding motility-associated C-terminal domain-containing protein, partial [Bacteroidota bacterium]